MNKAKEDIFTQAAAAYLSKIDSKLNSLNGQSDHPAATLRQHAREQFAATGFPGRKSEDWKYTSVRPILTQEFREGKKDIALPEGYAPLKLQDPVYHITLLNGRYVEGDTSGLPADMYVGLARHAWESDSVRNVITGAAIAIEKTDMPVFEALALGLTPDPVLIRIPDNCIVDRPLVIDYVAHTDDHRPVAVHPFVIIDAGKHSKVEIVERFFSAPDTPAYTNVAQRIFVRNGAHVIHYRLQQEGNEALHTAQTTVVQDADSTYGTYVVELGSRLMRNNVHVEHIGTNSTTNLYGVFAANDRQHIDTQSFIDHAIPHCQSNELYKGVLQDRARGVFNGKIIVRPDAQKTNAFQQNSTLLLSPHAVMDSKPQLEIFADDVRCSHGATIGQLDETQVFYLRSRGLTRKEATGLLQRAFLQEVLERFPNAGIAAVFAERLHAKMENMS